MSNHGATPLNGYYCQNDLYQIIENILFEGVYMLIDEK
jgi:hypothetical protein